MNRDPERERELRNTTARNHAEPNQTAIEPAETAELWHSETQRAAGPYPPAQTPGPQQADWADDHRAIDGHGGNDDRPMTTSVVDERSGGDPTGGERDMRKRLNERGLRQE